MFVEEAFWGDNSREWAVDVSKNLQDWEVEEYEDLLQLLATIHLNNNKDKLIWNLKKNGIFSIKSFYRHMVGYREAAVTNFLTEEG